MKTKKLIFLSASLFVAFAAQAQLTFQGYLAFNGSRYGTSTATWNGYWHTWAYKPSSSIQRTLQLDLEVFGCPAITGSGASIFFYSSQNTGGLGYNDIAAGTYYNYSIWPQRPILHLWKALSKPHSLSGLLRISGKISQSIQRRGNHPLLPIPKRSAL